MDPGRDGPSCPMSGKEGASPPGRSHGEHSRGAEESAAMSAAETRAVLRPEKTTGPEPPGPARPDTGGAGKDRNGRRRVSLRERFAGAGLPYLLLAPVVL